MADQVPFGEEAQLSDAFDYLIDPDSSPRKSPDPFPGMMMHVQETLPDYPEVALADTAQLTAFLKRSFCAPDLEIMAPHLWMMSTQSHANVNPLHHQLVKGRTLVISEDPRLHLVWISTRIFIKPLPAFLLSHAFWAQYLLPSAPASPLPALDRDLIARSARGYLRTYAYLIQHPSDFALARQHALIPAHVSRAQFFRFVSRFRDIDDEHCSKRYAYGELRLTRLNFYGKFILRAWHFEHVHPAYGEYFSRFYGPLLFVFSVLSLILNALQLEMGVEQTIASFASGGAGAAPPPPIWNWIGMWEFCRWMALVAVVIVGGLALGLLGLLLWFHANEWTYAIKHRLRRRRANRKAEAVEPN